MLLLKRNLLDAWEMPHLLELIMNSNSGTGEDESLFLDGHKMSLIVVFSSIFTILTIYSIIQCYLYRDLRTSSSRNHASWRDLNELDPDDHPHSTVQIQAQGRGLELWVISSLPTSQFKKNEGSNRECAICMGEFEEEDWVKRLPSCAHVFHVSCIATWFRSHTNCPLCRSIVNVNHDHLALSLESSVSLYASPCETLSREGLSPERPSQLGRHTRTQQPTSCSN